MSKLRVLPTERKYVQLDALSGGKKKSQHRGEISTRLC